MTKFFAFFLAVAMVLAQCYAQELDRGAAVRLIAKQADRQLGQRHADIETPDGLLSTSTVELLGMPDGNSGDVTPFDGGRYLVSGCRPQSCAEKAAVVFGVNPPRLYAIGFRNYNCRFIVPEEAKFARPKSKNRSPVTCDADPAVKIYILRSETSGIDAELERKELNVLRNWSGIEPIEAKINVIVTP